MHEPANGLSLRKGAWFAPAGNKPLPLFLVPIFLALVGLSWAWIGVKEGDAAEAPTTSGVVKWHPGHYYAPMLFMRHNPAIMAQVYRELQATSALRGLQIRFEWPELEPEEGRYDFTAIERVLAELVPQNKRLVVLLELKSFRPDVLPVPAYMATKSYEGGAFPFSSYGKDVPRGYNLTLWNSKVHARLVALIRELGKRFNGHAHFEGIGLPESSMGQPLRAVSRAEVARFYDNLLSVQREMRIAFVNTMTYQFVNYPREILPSFVERMRTIGTALGGPDVFLDDPGLNFDHPNKPKGVYHFYAPLSGIVPLAPSVMQSNYDNTRHDGTGRVPTVAELLTFARDRLKANYIFWTRAPNSYSKVLDVMNGLSASTGLSGGLDATCPKAYASCAE
ncbi:MAG: Glycoside hydrolase [Nitrospira sp.]|nr:glycoside hydrolase [Nitrospira sp.]ULA61033.1 MAG: Glycoside hydrolase [Nitrospira sp.]